MTIEYHNSKEVECYRDFVKNPDNRKAMRAFERIFGKTLMEPAKKLHDRLLSYKTAGAYNADYGCTNNRIELKQGCRDREPLVMKVRVDGWHRKFFHHLFGEGAMLKKDWTGDFNSVEKIYVIDVNNHDYKKV